MGPAIVVAAFARPQSLRRILDSLAESHVPAGTPLVISIDYSKDAAETVRREAENFSWPQGEKRILLHPAHLGLRRHILSCGDLSKDYGSIILLEDDLYVSPEFYNYTLAALKTFKDDPRIAGISLYNHRFNETASVPFCPIEDGFDSYFVQMASSWGQCWTSEQWSIFRRWHDENYQDQFDAVHLPKNVLTWPETSWKRYFIIFLVTTGRYFVYPRASLTTNFGDPGSHFWAKTTLHQVPLLMAPKLFRFSQLQDSIAVYDSYCEILPAKLKRIAPALAPYDFEVDFFGTKDLTQITAPYILTTRMTRSAALRFGLDLKPHELNVARGIEGSVISLARKEDCTTKRAVPLFQHMIYYHDLHPSWIKAAGRKIAETDLGRNAQQTGAKSVSDQIRKGDGHGEPNA